MPLVRQSAAYSAHRLAEMDAHETGVPYRHPDWSAQKALALLSRHDTDALRALRAIAQLLPGAGEALSAPITAAPLAHLMSPRTARRPAVPNQPRGGVVAKASTMADVVAALALQAERLPLARAVTV